ncbi:MAG: hypothetical protein ABI273_15410, partial [Lacunisphaera sp.]
VFDPDTSMFAASGLTNWKLCQSEYFAFASCTMIGAATKSKAKRPGAISGRLINPPRSSIRPFPFSSQQLWDARFGGQQPANEPAANFAADWNGSKIKSNPTGSSYGMSFPEIKLK